MLPFLTLKSKVDTVPRGVSPQVGGHWGPAGRSHVVFALKELTPILRPPQDTTQVSFSYFNTHRLHFWSQWLGSAAWQSCLANPAPVCPQLF